MSAEWLVFDIGCIECGEESRVVGVFAAEEKAKQAAEAYTDPESRWGRPEWHGEHSVAVFPLPVLPHPTEGEGE